MIVHLNANFYNSCVVMSGNYMSRHAEILMYYLTAPQSLENDVGQAYSQHHFLDKSHK
jgi:hypothetical protein